MSLQIWDVDQAVRQSATSIVVPDNEDVEIGPGSEHVLTVKIERFQDVQVVGYIPRRMPEDEALQAIRADDETALRHVLSSPPRDDCGCDGQGSHPQPLTLQRQYRQFRNYFNPALAAVISRYTGVELRWDSPIVGIGRNVLEVAKRNHGLILDLLKAQDITIGLRSTLTVNAHVLLANNILVHDTGTLKVKTSHLRIWANSIVRFGGLTALDIGSDELPGWVLADV